MMWRRSCTVGSRRRSRRLFLTLHSTAQGCTQEWAIYTPVNRAIALQTQTTRYTKLQTQAIYVAMHVAMHVAINVAIQVATHRALVGSAPRGHV